MPVRTRLPHAIVAAVIAVALVCCALVQFASDALYAQAGPGLLAGSIPRAFGIAVYAAIDRVAPADYVEDALGHVALASGDATSAQRFAVRMPAGPRRDGLLADVARARSQPELAFEYDFAAADVGALNGDVMAAWPRNHARAIALERLVRSRLLELGTHPDAVAESDFVLASFASWSGDQAGAYTDFRAALEIAPLNMKYVLGTAVQALTMHDDVAAERYFRAGLNVNPSSGDALAGLGVVALHRGDRAAATAYLARARAAEPGAGMIHALERALQ